MLVRCSKNKVASLEDSAIRAHVEEHVHLESIDLTIGERYHVFGVFFRTGIPWFLICRQISDDYPVPYCSMFFERVEGSISAGWRLSLAQSNVGEVSILPERWAKDPRFLERLVDG